MPVRHLAQFPDRVLQPFAQALEALGIAHRPRFPVRVRQHEVIDQVRKALPLDGDAQLFHVREVGRAQSPRWVLLREEHLLGRSLGRPPALHPTLQRAQLPVRKTAGVTPLQVLEHRLGFQPGVDLQKFANLRPTPPRTDPVVSATVAPPATRSAPGPGADTCAPSSRPSPPWPPQSLDFPLSSPTQTTSSPACQ